MKYTPIIDGFKEPIIEDSEYFFGGGQLTGEILRADGQWTDFLPADEKQEINFETYNCTAFATTSCLEILLNLQKQTKNFSDRFVGIQAGTGRGGNSPHKVAEAIRKSGLISEEILPFGGNNIDEYYSIREIDKKVIQILSRTFLKGYSIKHDWVITKSSPADKLTRQRLMMEALRYSPLGVSVHAWMQNDDGFFTNTQALPDNHWTACVGYKEGEYWIIYDSYEPHLKHLAWDFPFQFSKRYHLEVIHKQDNWIIDLLKRFGII